MWRWLAFAVVCLATIVQAATFSGVGINGAGPAGPTYQGIGDLSPGVAFYYAPGTCYTATYAGSTVIIKDWATDGLSTVMGCSGGVVARTSGSPLTLTCNGPCLTDTGYDQSPANACIGPAGAAPCIFQQTQVDYHSNPTISMTYSPNGNVYCEHYVGWGDGSPSITSGTYDNTTGKITLTLASVPASYVGDQRRLAGLTGTGAFASLNGYWFVIAPAPGGTTTLTLQGPTGVGASTITGGTAISVPQTLNNVTNGYNNGSGFGPYNEPYSVMALATTDGYTDAGFGGVFSATNIQTDANPLLGFNTNIANPSAKVVAYNGNVLTATVSAVTGTFYSILTLYNGSGSKICINGVCSTVDPGGLKAWNGLSFGNETGGWGGNLCEAAMWPNDQSGNALAFYTNQKARFGNF